MPTPDPLAGDNHVARLALADGTIYNGRAFGAVGRGLCVQAEVVFNTALTGYQESLSDPSYSGQILVQTCPLIGNTGVNPEDVESAKVQVAAFVVRERARRHSNFRATADLDSYLRDAGVLAIEDVDTRALTRRLRVHGCVQGVLTDRADLADDRLVEMARNAPSMEGQNLVPGVGCARSSAWRETLGDWAPAHPAAARAGAGRRRVLALDCGAKRNILRHLAQRRCDVEVIPHDTPAAEIRRRFEEGEADGLFISNGPGDPAAVRATVDTLRSLVRAEGRTIPMFGICLGHQLLALALGARTYKLKFGHRGTNQPVLNEAAGKVEITSQNHGFAVDARSLEAAGGRLSHRHLNDGTVAGFRVEGKPILAVQYHPEASPGPHDAGYLFDEFCRMMDRGDSRGVEKF